MKAFHIFLYFISHIIKTLTVEICSIRNESCFRTAKNELERWTCFGEYIFRSVDEEYSNGFTKLECRGVGFGNFIRGLNNAFDVAALFDRPLIINFEQVHQLWSPPYGLKSWDYAVLKSNDKKKLTEGTIEWGKFRQWLEKRNASGANAGFTGNEKFINRVGIWKPSSVAGTKIISVGMCAQSAREFSLGKCSVEVLTNFGKCLNYPTHNTNGIINPFRRLRDEATIRERLNLPHLPPKYEPQPGVFGLHTPEYYILAFHFRRIPLGFEPHSVDFNNEQGLEQKIAMLKAYWKQATRIATQAKEISTCRKEKLLIYFATDDVRGLRPEAIRHLSSFGRVVFGLTEDEVGHCIGWHWRDGDAEKVKELASELKRNGITPEYMNGKASRNTVEFETDAASGDYELIFNPSYETSPEVQAKQAYMALVEWWVLGSSNWLVSHSGTSYSDTAAGWGLGPNGHMERFDKIHDENSASITYRKDWNKEGCPLMYAADPDHSTTCPNLDTSRFEAHPTLKMLFEN